MGPAPEGLAVTGQFSTFIIDTGTPTDPRQGTVVVSPASSIFPGPVDQDLAVQFVLTSTARLTQPEAFLRVLEGGPLEVTIRGDSDGLPGELIASRAYEIGLSDFAWIPFGEYGATLPSGTYWLALEADPAGGFAASVTNSAPDPLPDHAFRSDFTGLDWTTIIQSWGFRIQGSSIDPREALIETISALEDAGTLSGGQANSLRVKIRKIETALESGRTQVVRNLVRAFTNQVESLIEDGILTRQEGSNLVAFAAEIAESP